MKSLSTLVFVITLACTTRTEAVSIDDIRAANPGAPETTIERLYTIQQNQEADAKIRARSLAASAPDSRPRGRVKICREPAFTGAMDNKQVVLSEGSTYTSPPSEADMRSHFQIMVPEAVTLPPGKAHCVTVDARLLSSDRIPQVGDRAVQQYTAPGFDARVTVMTPFK